jgi:hypothetical protein
MRKVVSALSPFPLLRTVSALRSQNQLTRVRTRKAVLERLNADAKEAAR